MGISYEIISFSLKSNLACLGVGFGFLEVLALCSSPPQPPKDTVLISRQMKARPDAPGRSGEKQIGFCVTHTSNGAGGWDLPRRVAGAPWKPSVWTLPALERSVLKQNPLGVWICLGGTKSCWKGKTHHSPLKIKLDVFWAFFFFFLVWRSAGEDGWWSWDPRARGISLLRLF